MSKTLVVDDKTYKYQIWDTAGQEKVGQSSADRAKGNETWLPDSLTFATLLVSRFGANVLQRGCSCHFGLRYHFPGKLWQWQLVAFASVQPQPTARASCSLISLIFFFRPFRRCLSFFCVCFTAMPMFSTYKPPRPFAVSF